MATQNLVSASISPELKASVLEKIITLKNDLNFVISMEPGAKREHLSVGNVMLPFLDKTHDVALAHPEILPGIFDKDEFMKDYQLTKDLTPIVQQLTELTSAIQDTLYAANSDTMVEALEIYAACQQHVDKVPGMDSIVSEMRSFFKKSRKQNTAQ